MGPGNYMIKIVIWGNTVHIMVTYDNTAKQELLSKQMIL